MADERDPDGMDISRDEVPALDSAGPVAVLPHNVDTGVQDSTSDTLASPRPNAAATMQTDGRAGYAQNGGFNIQNAMHTRYIDKDARKRTYRHWPQVYMI